MQFSEVKQVTQAVGAGNANRLLNEGWVLLAVVPASVNNPTGGGGASAMYVLGKNEPAPVKKDPMAGVTAADLARANEGL